MRCLAVVLFPLPGSILKGIESFPEPQGQCRAPLSSILKGIESTLLAAPLAPLYSGSILKGIESANRLVE